MRLISILAILFITVLIECSAKPFLYNSGKTILQSLFSPKSNSSENIEDLRDVKSQNGENQQNIDEEATTMAPRPGIIHKKLAKVLRKLQLFSALRHRFNQIETDDFDSSEEGVSTTTVLYPSSDEIFENSIDSNSTYEQLQQPGDDGKLSLQQGSLGVYFMELFGTIATLFYGAVIHAQHAINATNNRYRAS